MNSRTHAARRRSFLLAMSAATTAAAVASAIKTTAPEAAAKAGRDGASAGRLSEHARKYYRSALL